MVHRAVESFTLRYFSCPAKSTKLNTLLARLQISSHVNLRPEEEGCVIGCDLESKPRISPPTLDVRPDSISCLCLFKMLVLCILIHFLGRRWRGKNQPEQVHTCFASSIIENSFCQYTQQGRFASILL